MKKTKILIIGVGLLLFAQSCSMRFIKDPVLETTIATVTLGFGNKKSENNIDSTRIFGKKEEIRTLLYKVNESYIGKELALFRIELEELKQNKQYDIALKKLKEILADDKFVKRHDIYWNDFVDVLFLKGERKQAREIADSLIATEDDVIKMLNGGLHFQLAQDACQNNDYESAKLHYEKSWYRKPLVDYLGKPIDSLFPSRDIDFLRDKGVWNNDKPKFIYIWSPG